MRLKTIFLRSAMLLAFGLAAPAQADISARYEDQRESSSIRMVMTLEAEDGGNLRFQVAGQPNYLLIVDGVSYQVSRSETGVVVARLEDVVTVIGEAARSMGVDFSATRIPSDPMPKLPELIEIGEQQVNGRSGIAYGIAGEDGKARFALIVVSKDPKLAPLGTIMARSFDGSLKLADKMMPGFGSMFGEANPMAEIFKKGALLSYWGMNLTDVSFDEIPADRFKLPAAPISIDQIREQYRDFAAPPTLPIRN